MDRVEFRVFRGLGVRVDVDNNVGRAARNRCVRPRTFVEQRRSRLRDIGVSG